MPISNWIETVSNAITDGKIADVIREQGRLLEIQRDQATADLAQAKVTIAKKDDEILRLELRCGDLEKELASAKKQIEDFEDGSHGLPELSVRLLQSIASHKDSGSFSIRDYMGLNDAKFDYLIDKLRSAEFVRRVSFHPDEGHHYMATAEGREFLAKNDLL